MTRALREARRPSPLLALACAGVVACALASLAPPAPRVARAAPSRSAPATPPASASASASRTPVPLPVPEPDAGPDEATRRATELQRQIGDIRAEEAALGARAALAEERIYRQALLVEASRQEALAAQAQFGDRMVSIYKAGRVTTLELLFSARSFAEVLDRGMFLLTILDRDQAALQLATKLSAEASYEEGVLRGLRTQDAALREVQASRLKTLRAALGQQRSLATSLSVQQRAYVDGRARFDAGERNRWKAGSYRGAPPRRVPAAVEPYTDRRYLVDDGEPLAYASTGRISTELCSWYGNAGNGTATASGRAYNENEFTCATVLRDPEDPSGVRMLPFGTRLALTRGDRRIIVAVTDRGPYAGKRTIDLSRSAAEALGFDGLAEVNVEIVTAK